MGTGPGLVQSAYLLPENREKKAWEVSPPVPLDHWISIFFGGSNRSRRVSEGQRSIALKGQREKAILLSVSRDRRDLLELPWRN